MEHVQYERLPNGHWRFVHWEISPQTGYKSVMNIIEAPKKRHIKKIFRNHCLYTGRFEKVAKIY